MNPSPAEAQVVPLPRIRRRPRINPDLPFGATSRPSPEDVTQIELQGILFPDRRLGDPPLTPDKIRRIRLELRLSQTQFGQLVNVSTITVGRWERGTAVAGPWLTEALQAIGAVLDHHTVGDTVRLSLVYRGAVATFQDLLSFVYVK